MKPIISPNVRIRVPDLFNAERYSVVDDFCYFSTKVKVGICSHIASGCSVAGGRAFLFSLGAFSSLSSGVKVWCSSNDFVNDLVTLLPSGIEDPGFSPISGDVIMENFTGVGSNSVIMPSNIIPEGTVIGALSLVPPGFALKPWAVYAGNPIRFIKMRNKDRVLAQAEKMKRALGIQL